MKHSAWLVLAATLLSSNGLAADLISLEGTKWAEGSRAENVFVEFESGNKIFGGTRCSRFSGAYVQNKNALAIGPITLIPSLTRKICVEPKTSYDRVFSSLAATRSAEIEGQNLILKGGDNALLLRLQRNDLK